MINVWLILLGAALAVIGGTLGKLIEFTIQDRRTRRLYKVLLLQEIEKLQDIMDRLYKNYEKIKMVLVEDLIELASARVYYDRLPEYVAYIPDKFLRENIIKFYYEQGIAVRTLVELVPKDKPEEPNLATIKEQINRYVGKLKELLDTAQKIREKWS